MTASVSWVISYLMQQHCVSWLMKRNWNCLYCSALSPVKKRTLKLFISVISFNWISLTIELRKRLFHFWYILRSIVSTYFMNMSPQTMTSFSFFSSRSFLPHSSIVFSLHPAVLYSSSVLPLKFPFSSDGFSVVTAPLPNLCCCIQTQNRELESYYIYK